MDLEEREGETEKNSKDTHRKIKMRDENVEFCKFLCDDKKHFSLLLRFTTKLMKFLDDSSANIKEIEVLKSQTKYIIEILLNIGKKQLMENERFYWKLVATCFMYPTFGNW